MTRQDMVLFGRMITEIDSRRRHTLARLLFLQKVLQKVLKKVLQKVLQKVHMVVTFRFSAWRSSRWALYILNNATALQCVAAHRCCHPEAIRMKKGDLDSIPIIWVQL